MPLDVVRLRDGDISAISTGDEFRCAVLLWCASWHQVPAASIPDDDIVLAQLAGFGRVVKEWKKVRHGALRGWIKCTDDRLYHHVVAEKANEAWVAKMTQRWKTECARIKKYNQRHGTDLPYPELSSFLSPQCPSGHYQHVPGDDEAMSPQCPSGNGIQGTGIGTGIGTEIYIPTNLPSAGAGEGEGENARPVDNSGFRMFVDWKPSAHLSTLARQAGLPMPDTGEFNAAVGEFIAYWLTQARTRTQHEWDHALVKAIKGNRLRSTGQKAESGRRQPKAENFAAIDYGNGGKL